MAKAPAKSTARPYSDEAIRQAIAEGLGTAIPESQYAQMGSREALLPGDVSADSAPRLPVRPDPFGDRLDPAAQLDAAPVAVKPSVMDAISQRLFGSPHPAKSAINAYSDVLGTEGGRDQALREEVARRTLESDQFGKEGSSGLRRALLGATIGAKAGLSAPYGSSALGAGILGGLEGASGVVASEEAKAHAKGEAVTKSLADLMANEAAKKEEIRKGEVDRSEATSKLLSQAQSITPWDKGMPIPENALVTTLNGRQWALTPKPEYSELFKILQATGKGSGEAERSLMEVWKETRASLKAPKTAGDETSRARDITTLKNIEANLKTLNPMLNFPPIQEMTEGELQGKGALERGVELITGANSQPQAKIPTLAKVEERFGYQPNSLRWMSAKDQATLLKTPEDKQKRFIDLLLKEHKAGVR